MGSVPATTVSLLVATVAILGTALGSFAVSRRQQRQNWAQDLEGIVAALEASNKTLREELIRVTAHRDQLLAEQAALLRKLLANGNGGKRGGAEA